MIEFLAAHAFILAGIPTVLFLNGLLVSCEFALIKVRFSHFNRELREQVEAHRFLGPLLAAGDRTVRVIRLGLTACLILYALLFFPLLMALFDGMAWEGSLARGVGAVAAFAIAVTLHQLVGELFPRGLGLAYPYKCLRVGTPVILIFGWLSRPLRILIYGIVRFFWRVWRKEALPDLDSLELETQIELLRKESPRMSMVAQLILKNTLLMRELVVADVLLPRNQVKYLDLNLPLEENLELARSSGHTRFPLCYGDLDRCIGLVHIKDIFRSAGDSDSLDLRRLKRNMIRIDSEEPLESALTKLLSHRMHMALVIDEFRGTEGVLTLERILEQLVGEIRDEFDADEEVLIKSDPQTEESLVSGLTPLHEVEAIFGTELDAEEVSTIGGLVTSEMGRIPEVGERLEIADLAIEVTGVDETRVLEVRIRALPSADTETPGSDEADSRQ